MDRREMKTRARGTLRRHYWLFVVVCLFAAFLGAEHASSLTMVRTAVPDDGIVSAFGTGRPAPLAPGLDLTGQLLDVAGDVADGDLDEAKAEAARSRQEMTEQDTDPALGRTRGVLAAIINSLASGSLLVMLADAIRSFARSDSIAVALLVAMGLGVVLFVWLFIRQSSLVVVRRIALEARVYRQVPLARVLYPIHTRRWAAIAGALLLTAVYQTLWAFTIVGGVVKHYAYILVPYILAENPTIGANEAIGLSRRMMRGHKWHWFVAQCSFLGWHLLNMATFGLSGILYSNGYRSAFYAEYYAAIRIEAKAQGVEGSDALCDDCLFARPSPARLADAYGDVIDELARVRRAGACASRPDGPGGLLASWFGVTLTSSGRIAAWEAYREREGQLEQGRAIVAALAYPGRLAPAPMALRLQPGTGLGASRSYSVLHLTVMFFIFCIGGWVWEVMLAFVTEGTFVNRGTLHGPWLPIYGMGAVLILVVLKRLRERPLLEFAAAMALCGTLEYAMSCYLEYAHGGQRWWDYTGYFLNLDGRICAEGVLTFGLGGLAVVYLVAPALDNLLRRVNARALVALALTLVVCYGADQAWSAVSPNTGAGITDYRVAASSGFERGADAGRSPTPLW